jgi:aldose 1-epimerase
MSNEKLPAQSSREFKNLLDLRKYTAGTGIVGYTIVTGQIVIRNAVGGGGMDHLAVPDVDADVGNVHIVTGKEYQVALNDHGVNHLHGGNVGFSAHFWTGTAKEGDHEDSVSFHRISPDGEENYPGNLDVTVTYTWNDMCDLIIRYEATTDKPTLCNLTNHTYFNLGGHKHGTVKDHEVAIDADVITKVDAGLIPTGDYMPVVGTPLDLRDGLLLEEGLEVYETCPQMVPAGGYDHNFVLRKGEAMGAAASVYHEESGRYMEVLTDQPAIQLYTACTTDIKGGKEGMNYGHYSGFCLETQHCPDDPNHPNFPGTTILRPGEKYDTTTIYAFRADE